MQAVLPMMILFRVTLILNRCFGPDARDIGVSSLGNAAGNQRAMLVLCIALIYRLQMCKTDPKNARLARNKCGTTWLDICILPTAPKKARGREP